MISSRDYASLAEVRAAIRAERGLEKAHVLAFCSLRSYARYAPPESYLEVVNVGSPYGLQSWHIAFWVD